MQVATGAAHMASAKNHQAQVRLVLAPAPHIGSVALKGSPAMLAGEKDWKLWVPGGKGANGALAAPYAEYVPARSRSSSQVVSLEQTAEGTAQRECQ